MPKPTTKFELLQYTINTFEQLNLLVDSYDLSVQNKEFRTGTLNRNIRDVLAHLHHWHKLFMEWYRIGMKGDLPEMPDKGYTWQTMPLLNVKIWEMYQGTPLNEVRELLYTSHQNILKIAAKHSDQELFEKKKYAWTGSTSIAGYFIPNCSSHYNWGIKLIKKCTK